MRTLAGLCSALVLAGVSACSAFEGSVADERHGYSDYSPRFSPDGRRIAFVSDRSGRDEIYIVTRDGRRLQRLARAPRRDTKPSWSPDGSQIAFIREMGHGKTVNPLEDEVFVATLGGALRRITDNEDEDWAPSFAPDGRRIVFEHARGNEEVGTTLVIVAFAEGQAPVSIDGAPDDWESPDWNRRGILACDFLCRAFVLLRPDGNVLARVPTGGTRGDIGRSEDSTAVGGGRLSPDGRRVVFAATPTGGKTDEIYVLAIDTGHRTRLTRNTASDDDPSWSPDERQIIFASDRSGSFRLHLMNADGSRVRQIPVPRPRPR